MYPGAGYKFLSENADSLDLERIVKYELEIKTLLLPVSTIIIAKIVKDIHVLHLKLRNPVV